MSELARSLSIVPQAWERVRRASLAGAAGSALGAWAVMAWNRFGSQGLLAPRAGVRFLLIGFYTWVGLALTLWLGLKLASWLTSRSRETAEVDKPPPPSLIIQLSGLAHRPLLVVAVVIQLLSLIVPGTGPGGVVAAIGLGLWMPAMLVSGLMWARPQPVLRAALIVALPYLAWLATAGRFLLDRVGHLL